MYPFTRLYLNLRLRACKLFHLLGENTSGIDDVTSMYSQFLLAKAVPNAYPLHLPLFSQKRGHLRIIGDYSAILSGSTDERHCEAGVIRLCIIIDKALFQAIVQKRWSLFQYLAQAHVVMPLNIASSGH